VAESANLNNFSVLTSHKRVVPAMMALLESGEVNLDGFLCPGHVSVILGSESYRPVVERHAMPCVVGGFEETLIAPALAELAEMTRGGEARLVNLYPQAVTPGGNRKAQEILSEVYRVADVRWRGLGVIPHSGLVLRDRFRALDAMRRFELTTPADREPRGCLCGSVIKGVATPHDCELFGSACSPIQPIGPCMVSSEGTCQAWFKYNRQPVNPPVATTEVLP
jgi:hydrogenase expression/formation protein HypD